MDSGLLAAINEAWGRVEKLIERDPGELERRLLRRGMGMMVRPVRAWCLAVKSTDRRMQPLRFPMDRRPAEWDSAQGRWVYQEHRVLLRAEELRWLCRPVAIPAPGMTVRDVAEMLGECEHVVCEAVKRGEFSSVRPMRGLGGMKGWARIIYTKRLLDPAGITMGRVEDEGWGTMWRYASDHIPERLSQMVTRRPVWRKYGAGMRYQGFRWVCPGCRREVRRLYYPLPALVVAPFVKATKVRTARKEAGAMRGFACSKCHGVHDYGRLNGQGWNELIMHLSGGLLYGKEVRKPAWWKIERRRAHAPRPGYPPSKRAEQIAGLLVNTELSCSEIAGRLGLRPGTVQGWVGRIYQRNEVHARGELRVKVMGERRQEAKAAG